MGWPQYVYLALTLIGLGIEVERHGEPKTGAHNCVTTLIATVLVLWLLHAGGFFA